VNKYILFFVLILFMLFLVGTVCFIYTSGKDAPAPVRPENPGITKPAESTQGAPKLSDTEAVMHMLESNDPNQRCDALKKIMG